MGLPKVFGGSGTAHIFRHFFNRLLEEHGGSIRQQAVVRTVLIAVGRKYAEMGDDPHVHPVKWNLLANSILKGRHNKHKSDVSEK